MQHTRRCYGTTIAAMVAVLVLGWGGSAYADGRIDRIRTKGHITCGVLPGISGFATQSGGGYSGFEIDFCRALAAAVLGNPDLVKYLVVRTVDQFQQESEIDVVSRRLTWTMLREAAHGLLFSPVIFYDGAGFMVQRSSPVRHVDGLAGQPLCVHTGSEANRALIAYFEGKQFELVDMPAPTLRAAADTFFAGECVALVADESELAAERAAKPGGEYRILADSISKEPLALLVRQGDDDFFLAVRWTVLGLIAAEEEGLTSRNVNTASRDGNATVLESAGEAGTAIGLERDWLKNAVQAVGNYGEIYDRHLGAASPLKLRRGMNKLWTEGGLMYAPPFH